MDMVKWKYAPTAADGEIDPEAMLPKKRLDWYTGEDKRLDFQVKAGDLMRCIVRGDRD